METRIRIVDEVWREVTRESNPDDRWDRDDTSESHSIQGIRIVGEEDYFDLAVGFEVKEGETYYLLYGIYSTGDSFGHDEGRIHFVDLYTDRELAKQNADRLKEYNQKGDSEAQLVTQEGKKYKHYVPWCGYFERLSWIEVESVSVVEDNYRIVL